MNSGKPNLPAAKALSTDANLSAEMPAALAMNSPSDASASAGEPHGGALPDVEQLPVRSYSSDSDLRHPVRLVRDMFHDLWGSRELAWRLFLRDLNAQYRQSILGYLWVVLPAIGTMLIWVFLNANGILDIAATTVPYPVFVFTGLVLWEAFVSALTAPQTAVGSAMGLLTKLNFPREALLVSAAGQVVFGITVRLVLLIGVYIWFGEVPHAMAWFAPLGLIALMILGFAIGLFLTPAVMLYTDFSRGLAILTGPWFFLTPVVYPSPTTFPGTLINWLNPVSPLLTGTRELITEGTMKNPTAFISVGLLSVAGLFLAWMFCRLAMPHLIARMSP